MPDANHRTSLHMLQSGLSETKQLSHEFVKKRGWEKHDTTENLCLALSSEVGELADLVAWKSVATDIHDSGFIDSVSQELADVTILLLRFADSRAVDLSIPIIHVKNHFTRF